MPTEKRVPAALHHELTEYSYLLRALRTQYVLDLSAHLSQAPSRQQSEVNSDRESEDDGILSDEEDDGGPLRSTSTEERDTATQRYAERPPIAQASAPRDEIQQDTALKRNRKRQPTKTYTWTQWPLLAGDVNRPEFDLIDEVQLVASHVLKKRKITHERDEEHNIADNESSSHASDSAADENESGNSDSEEEELDDFASRAIAASTESYLRSLLSACSALVPQVSMSRRDRLSTLNWVSVLSAAAACRLVSPEALERAGLRLQALYGDKQTVANAPDPVHISEAKPRTLPRPVHRYVYALRTVKASKDRRNALLKERIERGDGNFLSFVMPPGKKKKTSSRKVGTRMKAETDVEEAAAKGKGKEPSQTSESDLDELDSSESEAGDKAEE